MHLEEPPSRRRRLERHDPRNGERRAHGTAAAPCATCLMRTRSSREAVSSQRRFDRELSASSCAWFAASERILEGVRRQRSTTMESYVGAKERILLLAHTVSVGPCSNVGRATCQTISTSIRETCAWHMARCSPVRALARPKSGRHSLVCSCLKPWHLFVLKIASAPALTQKHVSGDEATRRAIKAPRQGTLM